MLEREKTDKFKKIRIQLKVERTKDGQRRKAWSHKHGHDTYGDQDSGSGDHGSRMILTSNLKCQGKRVNLVESAKLVGPQLTCALATRIAHSISG